MLTFLIKNLLLWIKKNKENYIVKLLLCLFFIIFLYYNPFLIVEAEEINEILTKNHEEIQNYNIPTENLETISESVEEKKEIQITLLDKIVLGLLITFLLFILIDGELMNNITYIDTTLIELVEKASKTNDINIIICNENTNTIYYMEKSQYEGVIVETKINTILNANWFYKLTEQEQIEYYQAYKNTHYVESSISTKDNNN